MEGKWKMSLDAGEGESAHTYIHSELLFSTLERIMPGLDKGYETRPGTLVV